MAGRRRKIRCTYGDGRTNICNECFARGSTCIDQEHGELQANPASGEQSYSLRERVTHLEGVIKDILNRLDDGPTPREQETERAAEVLKNLKTGLANPDSNQNILHNGSAPVLSLFDNAVLKRQEDGAPMDPRLAEFSFVQPKDCKLRDTLLALLPSHENLTAVFAGTEKWWRVWRRMFPELYTTPEGTLEEFIAQAYSTTTPASIAKTLLCTAISLDQLPIGWDQQHLNLSLPAEQLMEKYVNTVHDLITSDDDIAGTIEGIECMYLETKHYVNVGRPRKAWLTFRRALSFAELLGIHRAVPKPGKELDKTYQRHYNLWCALVQGDRYLSLILGLPYSVGDHLILPHVPKTLDDTGFPPGNFYLLNLMFISGRIADRNQDPANMSLSASLRIDQELEELHDSMPPNTWNVRMNPHEDIEGYYDRLMAQFAHHQIRTLLHLPFMLKSNNDQRYQYSKIAAIEASRDMIIVYQALRSDEGVGPYICKVIDFQAFTAAMLLLLNLLGYAQGTPFKDQNNEENDWELVEKTIEVLRSATNEAGGSIASQSAKALELIASSRNPTRDCDGSQAAKIVIPYFGTISIGPGKGFNMPKPAPGTNSMQFPTPPNSHIGYSSSSATPTASCSMTSDPTQTTQTSTSNNSGNPNNPAYLPEADPFISFDSLWAMPPPLPEFPYDPNSNSDPTAIAQNGGTPSTGYVQNPTGAAGMWPNLENSLELDQGWNWFGFGGTGSSDVVGGSIDPNLRS